MHSDVCMYQTFTLDIYTRSYLHNMKYGWRWKAGGSLSPFIEVQPLSPRYVS